MRAYTEHSIAWRLWARLRCVLRGHDIYRHALMRIAREESGIWGTIANEALRAGGELEIGKRAISERTGQACCGWPQGCTNPTEGCAYLQHPYKRWLRGEITLEELQARTAA